MRTPFIAGNWKMYKSVAEAVAFVKELRAVVRGAAGVDIVLAPPLTALHAVADAARKADREVVVVGRAMERVVQVARETGYLDGVQNFRGADLYGHFPPDKVLALCTGSQGEPRAALARSAASACQKTPSRAAAKVNPASATSSGRECEAGCGVASRCRLGEV